MWCIFLLLVLVIASPLAYFELIYKRRMNRIATKFNRSKYDYPLIGFAWRMFGVNNEQLMTTLNGLFEETGGTFATWLGPQFVVGLSDPKSLQTVLNSNDCLEKAYIYKFLNNKTGLFTSDAETWKMHRRALNPTFNHKILLNFIPIFNEKARICVDKFEQYVNKPFDIYRPIYKLVTDILVHSALDSKMDDLQGAYGDRLYVYQYIIFKWYIMIYYSYRFP